MWKDVSESSVGDIYGKCAEGRIVGLDLSVAKEKGRMVVSRRFIAFSLLNHCSLTGRGRRMDMDDGELLVARLVMDCMTK